MACTRTAGRQYMYMYMLYLYMYMLYEERRVGMSAWTFG